jgi:hypothetical protein
MTDENKNSQKIKTFTIGYESFRTGELILEDLVNSIINCNKPFL